MLSIDFGRRVVIVDSSNELGGDSDVPHEFLGKARRMQVPRVEAQHEVLCYTARARLLRAFCSGVFLLGLRQVMVEAVENHMPEVRAFAVSFDASTLELT